MPKFSSIIAVLLFIVASIIFYNKVINPPYSIASKGPPKNRVLQVNGIVLIPKALDNNILSSGTLVASESVDLQAQASGSITHLNLREGSFVKAGTQLVKLFDDDLQAQLKKLEAQRESDERTESRMKALLAINGVGQQDYDNALTELKGALADIDNIKAQIEKTEIRAPFDGIVGLRNVSPGAYLTPATVVASLQKINPLKIDFSVPEKYAPEIDKGDIIKFTVSGFSKSFTANVFAIEPHVDEDSRMIKVRALVRNPDSKLLPGTFADVEVVLKRIDNALMVPSQCIIPDIRNKSVFIVKAGMAESRVVHTGIRTESMVQITDGLEAGDTVVTSSLLFVKPRMNLNVTVAPN
jgi:membrane fusion protein (multidrug efflux system)